MRRRQHAGRRRLQRDLPGTPWGKQLLSGVGSVVVLQIGTPLLSTHCSCSVYPQVEPGWECSKTSPSSCWRSGQPRPPGVPAGGDDPHTAHPDAAGGSGGGDGGGGAPPAPSSGGSHSHRGWVLAGIVVAVLAAMTAALVVSRPLIYDRFPQVPPPRGAGGGGSVGGVLCWCGVSAGGVIEVRTVSCAAAACRWRMPWMPW